MHCSKATRQLQLYIDKRLALDQIRVLETHLADCSECRENLFLLEEVSAALSRFELVVEPADLTANVMKRVVQQQQAQRAQQRASFAATRGFTSMPAVRSRQKEPLFSFRPSLPELVVAIVLATIAMFALVFELPGVRTALGLANVHNSFISFFLSSWNMLVYANTETLMTCIWVLGTILGIWITLIVAGADIRNQWFKAVMDRLPVHL